MQERKLFLNKIGVPKKARIETQNRNEKFDWKYR